MTWTAQTPLVSGSVPGQAYWNAFRDNLRSLRNGNEHYAKVFLSGNPDVSNNTSLVVSWAQVAVQAGAIWSSARPTRFTAPITGKYLLLCVQEWRSDSNNLRNISVIHRTATGTQITQFDLTSQGAIGGKSNLNAKLPLAMQAGEYIEVRAFQSSGATLGLHGGSQDRTRCSVIFLGT